MSPRPVEEIEADLQALVDDTDERLGRLAQKYSALKLLQDRVGKAVGEANRELTEAMEQQGLTRCDAEGAKITMKTKRSWGIAEGQTPDEYMANMEEARAWVEKFNPTQTDITQTNIKRTLDAFFAEGGDQPLPPFLTEHERTQLSVSRS